MEDDDAADAGDEPGDPEPDFRYYAMLRISSERGLDLDAISATLGVAPTHVRQRGVRPGPHGLPSTEDAWMYQPPVAEEADLHRHIDALWTVLKPHTDFIERMKSTAKVVVHLGYLSRMNLAGVSIPYRSLEMFRALELDFHLHITVIPDPDGEETA